MAYISFILLILTAFWFLIMNTVVILPRISSVFQNPMFCSGVFNTLEEHVLPKHQFSTRLKSHSVLELIKVKRKGAAGAPLPMFLIE